MAFGGIDGHRRERQVEGEELASKHHIPVGREFTGWRGMGRSNLSHETKFSGANGDREKKSFLADHGQRWQP